MVGGSSPFSTTGKSPDRKSTGNIGLESHLWTKRTDTEHSFFFLCGTFYATKQNTHSSQAHTEPPPE